MRSACCTTNGFGLIVLTLCTLSGCDSGVDRSPANDLDAADDDASAADEMDGGSRTPRDGVDASQRPDGSVSDDSAVPDGSMAAAQNTPPWPPDPSLLVRSQAEIDASPCRIYLDQGSDGDDEQSWGYRYDDVGTLVQAIETIPSSRGFFTSSYDIEVTLFDSAERPWVRCGRSCWRYAYDDDAATTVLTSYPDPPGQTPRGDQIEVRRDAQGRFARYHSSDAEGSEEFTVEFENGVPRTFWEHEPDEGDTHATFYPDGTLEHMEFDWDGEEAGDCDCRQDGWELTVCHEDREVQWNTTYSIAIDGSIQHSQTVIDAGSMHSFSADYIWSEGGGSVQVVAADDLGAWQETTTYFPGTGAQWPEYDGDGNLVRVMVDENGDSEPDVTHTYRYEGTGACRQGTNPQLQPRIPDHAKDLVPLECRFSPVTQVIESAYNI